MRESISPNLLLIDPVISSLVKLYFLHDSTSLDQWEDNVDFVSGNCPLHKTAHNKPTKGQPDFDPHLRAIQASTGMITGSSAHSQPSAHGRPPCPREVEPSQLQQSLIHPPLAFPNTSFFQHIISEQTTDQWHDLLHHFTPTFSIIHPIKLTIPAVSSIKRRDPIASSPESTHDHNLNHAGTEEPSTTSPAREWPGIPIRLDSSPPTSPFGVGISSLSDLAFSLPTPGWCFGELAIFIGQLAGRDRSRFPLYSQCCEALARRREAKASQLNPKIFRILKIFVFSD